MHKKEEKKRSKDYLQQRQLVNKLMKHGHLVMSNIQSHPDAKRLQLLLRDSPDKPRRIFDILEIRKSTDSVHKQKEAIILSKMLNPVVNAQAKNKEVIEAQRSFKEMYAGFLGRLTQLEEMTTIYAIDGPLNALKAQIRQYDYLFSTTLGQFPLISDLKSQEKFLQRTAQHTQMVVKLLKKCKFEIKRLTASTDLFKRKVPLIPQEEPPKAPTPPPPPPKPTHVKSQSMLPPVEKPKIIVMEEITKPKPPPPEPKRPAPPKAAPPTEVLKRPPPPETKRQVQSDRKERPPPPPIEPSPPSPEPAKDLGGSISDPGDVSESEDEKLDFVMKFEQFEAEAFRKFLKAMNLLHHFSEEHESRHIVSFAFMPTISEPQNEDILAFMRNFEIISTKVEIEADHFDQLFKDKHLQFLIKESSEIASFRFNVECITLAGYHAKKLAIVERRVQQYIREQKHFQFRHYPTEAQVTILRKFEEQYEVQKILFPNLKVSSLIYDPVEERPYFIFPSTYGEKGRIIQTIEEALVKIHSKQTEISEYGLQLLQLPDLNFPDLSFVQQLALKSNSVIQWHKEAQFEEEEALLLTELVPRPMASKETEEEEDKEEQKSKTDTTSPEKKEAAEEMLGLNVDRGVQSAYTLEVYATSQDNAALILDSLKKYLARLEGNKKFLKLSKEEGLEEDLSAQEMLVKGILGLRREKTDYAYDFEKRFSVLLYFNITETISGINIYGQSSQQRLAFVELGALFEMHPLTRREVEVSATVARVLDEVEKRSINSKLKREFKKAEFFVNHNVLCGKSFAVLYAEKNQAGEAQEEMQKLLQEYEDVVCTENLGPEYWVLREQMQKLKLNLKSKAQHFYNSSSSEQIIYLPKYGEKGQWMFQVEGSKVWKKYEGKVSDQLEEYYAQGEDFVIIGRSNFSINRRTPENWIEQTEEERFKVKRDTIKKIDRSGKRKEVWKPHGLLLRGQSDHVDELINVLNKRLAKHRAQASQFEIDHPYSGKLAAEVGAKYEVDIEGEAGSKLIRVVGKNKAEALREYLERIEAEASVIKYPTYWKEVELIGSAKYNEKYQLDPRGHQYIREATRFLDTIGNPSVKVIKIERLQDPEMWHRYSKEKSILAEMYGEENLEKILFHPQRASGDFKMTDFLEERKHNLSKFFNRPLTNTFSEQARYFAKFVKKSGKDVKEMVVSRVLLGNNYKADRKQGVEWIVPPQKDPREKPKLPLPGTREILIADELDQEETMRRLIDTPLDHEVRGEKVEYYDSVEVPTLQGDVFIIFHVHHSFPCYLVTYSEGK